MNAPADANRHMDALSCLVFQGYSASAGNPLAKPYVSPLEPVGEYLATLTSAQLSDLQSLADKHHVTIRAFTVIEKLAIAQNNARLATWCKGIIDTEADRVDRAIRILAPLCENLEDAGCPVTVIKSLDHWPDLGSDLDLYTSSEDDHLRNLMSGRFQATLVDRSWGDRLAHKWNFKLPHLNELVEVHVRYLGQTGEQTAMATRVIKRRVNKSLADLNFFVPAPEERVLISTLQRMYRHFYFRLCDMLDFSHLLRGDCIDFQELRVGAEIGGIWPGTAAFLLLVANYANRYGYEVNLPPDVVTSAFSPKTNVIFRSGFLRVPIQPAVRLYAKQLITANLHRDVRAILRLPLLPPLALSALLAHRLTGTDKGLW